MKLYLFGALLLAWALSVAGAVWYGHRWGWSARDQDARVAVAEAENAALVARTAQFQQVAGADVLTLRLSGDIAQHLSRLEAQTPQISQEVHDAIETETQLRDVVLPDALRKLRQQQADESAAIAAEAAAAAQN